MKRKLKNIEAERIKVMLAKGYKNSSIKETLKIKNNIEVSTSTIAAIKRGEQYRDVRQDLNEKIFAQYAMRISKEKQEIIEGVKFALANGYSEDEILHTYNISDRYFLNIKMLYAPFCNIAPEYNDKILSLKVRTKKVNIDSKMVSQIKEIYIQHNGKISYSQIAKMVKIDNGTVTNILNLKSYQNYGQKFNSRIRELKIEKENIRKADMNMKKRKIQYKRRIKELRLKEEYIKGQIRAARNELNAVKN